MFAICISEDETVSAVAQGISQGIPEKMPTEKMPIGQNANGRNAKWKKCQRKKCQSEKMPTEKMPNVYNYSLAFLPA
jgi:hypothetical protein